MTLQGDPPVATLSLRVATYQETMTLTKVKQGKRNNFQANLFKIKKGSFATCSNASNIKMTLTTTPDLLPHEARLTSLCGPSQVCGCCFHRSDGGAWYDRGPCLLICLSVLHACYLRASRHHLLSYPQEWGITYGSYSGTCSHRRVHEKLNISQ